MNRMLSRLALLVALAMALPLLASADSQIAYTFNSGSLFDFGGGNTYAATGTFTYDVTTAQVTAVDYDAVQIGSGPTGPFDFTTATTVSPTDVIFTGDGGPDGDEFLFAQSLATGGTIDITGGNYYSEGAFEEEVSASGSVTGAVATPEPSSILLLVSGLAGMGGMIRRKLKA